jgi:hypothetical protein
MLSDRHLLRALCVCFLVVGGSVLGAAQKPTIQHPIQDSGRATAANLDELWLKSDLVVEGAILAEHPLDVALRPGDMPIVFTVYDVQVQEQFKQDQSREEKQPIVHVRVRGGIRDRGSYLDSYLPDRHPMFQRGEHYILFLRHLDDLYVQTTGGDDSAFAVAGQSIRSHGRSLLSSSLNSLNLESFRSKLRRLGADR